MFLDIFKQELGYWFKKPITYFFGLVFFAFAFLVFSGTAGLFDPHYDGDEIKEYLNSYFGINFISLYFNKLLIILLPIIVGTSIHKDYKHRVHSILYSYPIDKTSYLMARFLASFFIVLLIASLVLIAIISAESLLGLDPVRLGPFKPLAYAQAFIIYIIPNLMLVASFVFTIILYARNIYSTFVAALIPFLLQIISENAFSGNNEMIALLDPFGQNSLTYYTRNWSVIEKNELVLPIREWVIYNRLLWTGISLILIVLSLKRFKLHEPAPTLNWKLSSKKKKENLEATQSSNINLNQIKIDYKKIHDWHTLWFLSKQNVGYILKSPAFWGIVALAILAMLFSLVRVTVSGDMILMPLTRVILMVPSAFYTIICIMLIFIYSGLLIHRERNARVNQLIDTTATPYWVLWTSKFLAMLKIELVLMLIFMTVGIITQSMQGYYQYEIGLYLQHLMIFTFIPLVIWTAAAFFIHILFNNLYLGLFILLFGWIGVGGLNQVGIDSHLLQFNTAPQLSYSDMNGYGHSSKAFFIVETYWMGFALILLTLSHLLWQYGVSVSIKTRLLTLRKRLSSSSYLLIATSVLTMIGLGFFILKEERKQFNFTSQTQSQLLSAFSENYGRFASLVSPKIRSLDANIELYPSDHRFEAQGSYIIENPWDQSTDTLLVKTGFDEVSTFDLSIPYEVISSDSLMKFHVLKLSKSLQPGQTFELNFNIHSVANSLFERNSSVLENGTCLKHDIFPRLGYTFSNEFLPPTDSMVRHQSYSSLDADLIDLSLTIGTDTDQIALAPGDLKKQWTEGNRIYFKYETSRPTEFSFGINSGSYNHTERQIGEKSVVTYSHHTANLDAMMSGIERTLNYQKQHFGDYQHDNIRIIEFPDSEGTYATAFANNIPMSEIRFVSNADSLNNKTDLAFYVPAHELVHHWWGGLLIPARAKGASMLAESITEYLTLNIYGSHYGKEAAEKFLSLQHRRYWNGHNKETGIEPPLYLVESHEQYISYGKGVIVMNALSHSVGENEFNSLLNEFMNTYNPASPPYPTSVDFVQFLNNELPDSLKRYLDEQFKQVVYFDNELLEAVSKKKGKGEYEVSFKLSTKKWRLLPDDPTKNPQESSVSDWVQVGIYDKSEKLIWFDWIHVESNHTKKTITLKNEPYSIRIDPNLLIIDKDTKDNKMKIVNSE